MIGSCAPNRALLIIVSNAWLVDALCGSVFLSIYVLISRCSSQKTERLMSIANVLEILANLFAVLAGLYGVFLLVRRALRKRSQKGRKEVQRSAEQ